MTHSQISDQIKQMMERQMTSDNCGDRTSERNWDIYMARTSGLGLEEVGNRFGVTGTRVSEIVAKCDRIKEVIKFREESPPDSLAAMRLTNNFQTVIPNWLPEQLPKNFRSIKVIDFLRAFPAREMLRCDGFGRGGLDFFSREAEKFVGKDVMMRWLYGEKV